MTLIAHLHQVAPVAEAVAETIATPTPGLGHGLLADFAAVAVFVVEKGLGL